MSQFTKNMFPKYGNFNNNLHANTILNHINGLFTTKNKVYQNNCPNPFNINNNQIQNNFNLDKNIDFMNDNRNQKENNYFNKNPINNIDNIDNNQNNNYIIEENSLKYNLNINNELMAQNYFTANNIDIGQSPIFEKESNSNLFGNNSNEDYKIYEQLVENNKSSIDKQILQNYEKNKNNNIIENKNDSLNNSNQFLNINDNQNNNNNIFTPQNNVISLQIKFKKGKNIPISKFNPINNNDNNNIESDKKSISEDIRNKLSKINITEMSPDWFKNENNFKDPFYFEKLKNYELERMGIKQLKLSDFLIGKKLGSGQFGRVYMAKLKSTQFICALKIINKNRLLKESLKCINQIRREIEIQSHLHHPNILSIYNFFWDKKNIYLVMEYAPGGELFTILHNEENGRFSESKAAFYINQVCDALEYIHKLHIIHRDIKPENILMSNEIIKLADFGWSIHQRSNKIRTTFCGTAEYMPPEVINDQPHIPSSDLWCLGILIYELCSGETPFTAKTDPQVLHRIKIFKMIKYPDYFSNEVKDLIGKLLRRSPKDRISIQEVKNHPWIIKNLKKYFANK